MHFVLKMNLEVVDTRLRARGIELAWAVLALYSRIVHVPYVLWRRLIRTDADRLICSSVDCSVAHSTFKVIMPVRLLLLQFEEGLGEPSRRWWLQTCQYD